MKYNLICTCLYLLWLLSLQYPRFKRFRNENEGFTNRLNNLSVELFT